MERQSLQAVSDDELLLHLADLIRDSRRTESLLVAHIAEVEEGRELRPDAVDPVRPRSAPVVEPLAPGRYKLQATGSAMLRDKLERLERRHFAQTLAPRKTLDRTTTAPLTRHMLCRAHNALMAKVDYGRPVAGRKRVWQ